MSVLGDWLLREFVPTAVGGGIVSTVATVVVGRLAWRRRNIDRQPRLPVDPGATAELPRVQTSARRRVAGMRARRWVIRHAHGAVEHAHAVVEAVRRG